METVGGCLQALFTYLVLPAVVIALFILIGYIIACFLVGTRRPERSRVFIAAVLPIVGVVFLVTLAEPVREEILSVLSGPSPWILLAVGLILGWLSLLLASRLARSDRTLGIACYVFFLSGIDAALLYVMIEGAFATVQLLSFGLVFGGGGYAIVRGMPELPAKLDLERVFRRIKHSIFDKESSAQGRERDEPP